MRIHMNPRTRRGVGEAVFLPVAIGVILAILLLVERWVGVSA